MVKEFHGKRYYIELDNYQLVVEAICMLNSLEMFKSLNDETFGIKKIENGNWVLYSDSTVENFRGSKYHDWEKFKRYMYKLKNEWDELK